MPAQANDAAAVRAHRRVGELVRLRWTVRGVLAFGLAASIAANVLHARPNPTSQMIAAWPPLSLLLTVELVSRIPVHRWWRTSIRIAATATVAGIAAWVSYGHMSEVACRFGETGQTPYLLPVSVDGLIVVASICLVELTGRIRDADTPPTPPNPTTGSNDRARVAAGGRGGAEPADMVPQRPSGAARRRPSRRAGEKAAPVAVRSDEQLLATLAELPRDRDGKVSVRRAAAALGTGPDRARRLLTQAGLRRIPDPDDPTGQTTT
jgi:Protein of unknown function (DUF2637)